MFTGLLGNSQKTDRTARRPLLPVDLNLGSEKFDFEVEGGAAWKSQSKSAQDDEKNISKLQLEVDHLREHIEVLEKEKLKELEIRHMVEFKNKLLLEMLAVAQLDADKINSTLGHERVKTEALKYELANLVLSKKEEAKE
jgi:hypothetical protein|eukprot:g4537.t1